MNQFTIVLINIFALVLMTMPGFILLKFGLIKDISKGITSILLYVCQPLLTFVSFQKVSYEKYYLSAILKVAILSLVVMGIAFSLFLVISKIFKREGERKALRYGAVFSNCAFMGLPLLKSIYGNENAEILVYVLIFVAVFNLYSWTIGVYAVSGEKKYISLKKALINPATIALFITFPLFLLDFRLSELSYAGSKLSYAGSKLFDSLKSMADMITPLSMTVIGFKLAGMNFKQLFLSKEAYISTAFKLLVAPLITMLIMLPFKVDSMIATALIFAMAMPTAMTTVLFSEKYGADVNTASSAVLLSTLLSLITIPIMSIIGTSLF